MHSALQGLAERWCTIRKEVLVLIHGHYNKIVLICIVLLKCRGVLDRKRKLKASAGVQESILKYAKPQKIPILLKSCFLKCFRQTKDAVQT